MDIHAQNRALEIIDEFIGKHIPQEAWDRDDQDWLVYCEGCGEILEYGFRIVDMDTEAEPWDCKEKARLIELRGLVE